jgi:hypothetical protein
VDRLERAVPRPQRLRATCKLEAKVFSSAARRVEMPLEGVSECCSGARSREDKQRCWHGGRSGPPGACSAEATAPQSPLQVPSERVRIGCSPLLRTAQVGRAWRCLLKACSGARLERASSTAGSAAAVDCQESAVPKPRRLCATCKCRASVLLSLARHGSMPLKSGVRGDAS